MIQDPKRLATVIDQHMGLRLRVRRRQIGMSPQRFADSLGLTFQPVQKCELGRNRVSASKLFHTALILGVAVSYFFEELDDPPAGGADPHGQAVRAFLRTDEGIELASFFSRIPSTRLRRQMLQLVRTLAS